MSAELDFINKVRDIVIQVADEHIMPYFKNLKAEDIGDKGGDYGLVTIADKNAEQALITKFTEFLPDSLFVGEETFSLDILDKITDETSVWIVDPIDGTSAFKDCTDQFAVMVALYKNKKILSGLIYWPSTRETLIATASDGVTFIAADDTQEKLTLKTTDKSFSFNKRYWPKDVKEKISKTVQDNIPNAVQVRYANQLGRGLAFGDFNAYLDPTSAPWDVAPVVAIYEAMGGTVKFLTGGAYELGKSDIGILFAPNEAEWQTYAAMLKDGVAI